MRALSARPFCPCDDRWVSLRYLSAGLRYTTEAFSRMILFGERALWHVLNEYMTHYHEERPHQGKGNVILFPFIRPDQDREGTIRGHERLGGLLKYYDRDAA